MKTPSLSTNEKARIKAKSCGNIIHIDEFEIKRHNTPDRGYLSDKLDSPDGIKQEILKDIFEILQHVSIEDAQQIKAFALSMNLILLPTKAPELYENRQKIEGKKENAPNFIKRVYADYLGKGFSKADIYKLDRKLYNALYNWLNNSKNALPEDLELPTKSEKTDQDLALMKANYSSGGINISREMFNKAQSFQRRLKQDHEQYL